MRNPWLGFSGLDDDGDDEVTCPRPAGEVVLVSTQTPPP